jgi:phage gpG-like protein
MIKASFALNWSGGEYSVRLHRELVKAVQKSGEMIQRTAVKSLSVSGKGSVAKSGINTVTGAGNKLMPVTTRKRQGRAGIERNGQMAKITGRTLKYTKNVKLGKLVAHTNIVTVNRVYWYGEPLHRWVQASQPGTPPHKQTGNLARIVVEKVQGGLRAKVGPKQGLIYARAQELGGKTGWGILPARPYMRPAFEQNQQAILFLFALAVQKAAK